MRIATWLVCAAVAVLFVVGACQVFGDVPGRVGPQLPSWLPDSSPARSVFPMDSGDAGALLEVSVDGPGETLSELEIVESGCRPRWQTRRYDGDAVSVAATQPLVGKEFVAVFRRTFVAAPVMPMWLLVSLRPPGQPALLDDLGMPGCRLMLSPKGLMSVAPDDGLVSEQGDGLVVRWYPPKGFVGRQVWMQAVWLDAAANDAGVMWSPMLRIRVGDRSSTIDWSDWWSRR